MTEESLFAAAVAIPNPAARAAYLDRACAGNVEFRKQLDALVAAHFAVDPVLDPATLSAAAFAATRDPDGTTRSAPTADETPGVLIAGRYKLLQQIGEGGMGTVWLAEQTEPVRRKVAVKLIRVERGQSKTILARFEAERQAIALMDHPHIAKLLDAGTTGDGQPFFVMELVKGVPLTAFCDQHRLTVPERLNLFAQICSAVQHAHQKGVIHRDLKPSNILVESHDGKPVPKVIDFGLAKATTGLRLTENTLFTGFGSVMGTPLYMAPEQATPTALDVDTRADVYALGVILYELLTGTTPITRETIKTAALDEMLRLIREQEPPTPSSRLSSSDSAPSVAANRQTEPAKLGRFMKGELDWITLKALSKDRDRRYETANGFAKDVERFLNHEPVVAGPPSAGYRLRKFVRRNRGPVLAGSVVLLALLLGIAGTTFGLIRAGQAADRESARADGEQKAKELAEKRLDQVRNGFGTLSAVFRDLDPKFEQKEGKTLREVLGERLSAAAGQLEGDAVGDPEVVADLQCKVGECLRELGHAEPAEAILLKALGTHRRLLGDDHPKALEDNEQLGNALLARGRYADAEGRYQAVLAARERVLGADHKDTLTAVNNLASAYMLAGRYADAEPLYRRAIDTTRRVFGADDKDHVTGLNNLGTLYYFQARYADAEPLYREALDRRRKILGETHTDTLSVLNNLANLYTAQNKYAAAEDHLRRAIDGYQAKVGDDHPHTLTAVGNLALLYGQMGRLADAEPLYRRVIDGFRRRHGDAHPDVLRPTQDLAALYWRQKRLDQSVPLFERAVEGSKAKLGVDHVDTLTAMANLGVNYRDAGRMDDAIRLLEEVDRRRAGKPTLAWMADSLVATYLRAGRKEAAVAYLIQSADTARSTLPAGSAALGVALAKAGGKLNEVKEFAAAEPLLRDAVGIREKLAEKGEFPAWMLALMRTTHGEALAGLKRYAEAEPVLLRGHDELTAAVQAVPARNRREAVRMTVEPLIALYTATNKPDRAAEWRAKLPREVLPPPRKE